MKRYISTLCMMLAGALIMTSCLKDTETDTSQYYTSTAITQFKLSSVLHQLHTTASDGSDSVYTETLSNPVVFTIDQAQRKIYNTDSLPSECDLTRVLATVSTLNSGTAVINYADKNGNDSLVYYSSTDSIDFTNMKDLRVYSQSGENYRLYSVTINMHKAETGKMLWQQMTAADMPADAKKAMWEDKAAAAGMKQLIGYGTTEGYAFAADSTLMVSKDNGATWTADEVDEDAAWLPTNNIAFASWPFAANDSTDYQMMIGTTDKSDKACVVWRKIAEYSKHSMPSKWVFIPIDSQEEFYLPKMENLNVVRYNNVVLAIGNDKNIYVSRDQGITWKTTTAYTLPDALGTNNLYATTDSNGYLWLLGKDTGEVWRGLILE